MPRLNFNVPFLDETGEPIMQPKLDKKATEKNNGAAVFEKDADGNNITEPVTVKSMLVRVLMTQFDGDKDLDFETKAKRGKLLRRIQNSSEVNYKPEELTVIQLLVAKAQTNVLFVAQVDDIINSETPYFGKEEEKEAA